MTNPIDKVFADRKALKLMTHVVAGYPDLETTETLIRVMAESGADLVEMQIPFSDPLADGPTIATANQAALDNGITPEHCFRLAEKLKSSVDIPLLIMTYANIPFSMGIEQFVKRCSESGISGMIVPDLPFDQSPWYLEAAEKYGCFPILVVSPGMSSERLAEIVQQARGFIYTTLRVGITGARKTIHESGLRFLETLRACTSLPIAAGFGISSAEMVNQLQGRADGAVIGSYIIEILNKQGIDEVGQFIRSCKAARGLFVVKKIGK